MAVTVLQLVTEALLEIGAINLGDVPDAATQQFVLSKYNRLLSNWNAERAAVWAVSFLPFTLVPTLQPHTIGPSGATFTVGSRPVEIEEINIILNNVTPAVRSGVNLRNSQWWAANAVQGVQTSIPTDCYYEPDWPNGSLFLWPIPTVAYGIEIVTRITLGTALITDGYAFPPGYQDAATLTVAEDLQSAFGKAPSELLALKAMQARARIFANNDPKLRMRTQDSGMPQGRQTRASFNYLTGMNVPKW